MEEGVGVGDAVLLVVYGSVEAAALLEAVALRPVFDQRRLVGGQRQLVDLGGGRVADAAEQTEGHVTQSHQLSSRVFLQDDRCSPGVQDTHEEQDQSHNSLGIPPLNNLVLASWTGAVQPDDTQKARVTLPVCETEEIEMMSCRRNHEQIMYWVLSCRLEVV